MAGETFVQAIYYQDPGRVEPVRAYCRALPPAARAAVNTQIGRLNMQRVDGPPLPFPHSSQVDGELRELRCHYGSTLYRILYRRSKNLIVLLHAFVKRTGAVPDGEIQIAKARWEDGMARMNPVPQAPRAFGHDAP